MKKYIFILFSLCYGNLYAQNTYLTEIHATRPIEMSLPFGVDTTDRNGKKFETENLLKEIVTIPEQTAFTKAFQSDTSGWFHPEFTAGKPSVQLFSFYVHADSYGKVKVTVASPHLLEIFVDGKSVASKKSAENSVSEAKDVTAGLKSYPDTERVVIKLLCNGKTEAALKVKVENDSENAQRGLHVSGVPRHNMVLDDAIKGKRVTNVSLSPSGSHVLLSYTENFGATATSFTELYTVKTGRRIVIDRERQKAQLQWMPKSGKLCYVKKEGDRTKLMSIHPETLEESVIAENIPNESVRLSPDEKTFFYSKAEESTNTKGAVFRMHTLSDRTGGIPSHAFIYCYDLETGLSRQLTFGAHATHLNDISRDGKYILFTISDETITEHPFRKSAGFRLSLETMQADTLWQNEKYVNSAQFSPDGTRILITGGPEAFGGIGLDIDEGQTANSYDTQAFIMELATRKITPVTRTFQPSVQQAKWNKNGIIYFQVEEEDRVCLYIFDPSAGKFTRLPVSEDVVDGYQTAEEAPVMVYSGVSVSNSTRAYLCDLKTGKSTRIADPYAEQLAQLTLGEVKDWNFTNSAGTEIKGRYYLPPNFDSSRKYPLIVYYYGGTSPTDRRFESRYSMHVYAALGYVVYVVQPSGATGFGQKFSALHVNTWGIRSSDDIIEGTQQFLVAHPFVDAAKIGCIGASYGGFMTMYLQTRTNLFAAAVSHAGISSISSYWGEGYWGYAYSAAASAGSYPWNNRDLYVNQSPLFNADKINTPLLLVHGTVDTNVPPGESVQMYTALKILGKPVELIQVEGENHHILTYEKRLKWNESIFAWFDKWLKNDSAWWDELYKK